MRLVKLKAKKDFDRVYKTGRSTSGSHMYFKSVKNDLNETRLKVVVSKKISNKAVVRNKNRRRVEEALRNIYTEIKKGYDGLFFLLKDTNKLSFKKIEDEIRSLIKRSGLLDA